MGKSQSLTLTHLIKTKAKSLGFSLSGITHPGSPPHLAQYLDWVEQGCHADMAYMATSRAKTMRVNPSLVLPGCKSIIVLGTRYADPQSIPPPQDVLPHGRIAAYAWGEDYHHVLKKRLDELGNFINQFSVSEVIYRSYTDTGPVLERELAQRAGLGWIGKNTCLINPEQGSYFFLAELFLSIDLEIDPPFTFDRCGTCSRCIQACPTGCILPGRMIDARRCIAYHTIENREQIPAHLHSQIGQWIFGCDICQIVCPWNQRFAIQSCDPAFSALDANAAYPVLCQESELSPQEFNVKYRLRSIQRTKWRGYQRNLRIALANHKV
jgi:epoxyqueuosine reductase